MEGDRNWFNKGYENGYVFASKEADYDELAAICRAGDIPEKWDLFRAEILNRYLGEKGFDFDSFSAGFSSACRQHFQYLTGGSLKT